MAQSKDPFDVTLTPDQRRALGVWLCDEVQRGIDARATQEIDVDYWHRLYEQAPTRSGRVAPWPDAADLTSYLACEKVDALHARIMKVIWTDPVWIVDGYGEGADKAPFVEEFHQAKLEEERLQGVFDKLVLQSLIEPRGLLEIAEGSELRTQRKRMVAAIELDPITQGPVYGEDGAPALAKTPEGQLIEATARELGAETVIDSQERIRTGPVYRLLPYRDSLILPTMRGTKRTSGRMRSGFISGWTRCAPGPRAGFTTRPKSTR